MGKLRIGFVGVGGMGQCAHLKNYAVSESCDVAAIAELREELGRKVAEHYRVPKTYPDHTAMLEAEDLDGIVASQPFERHGMLVPELLQAGIPVFTEKPLASTVAAGEKIAAAVESSGNWMMIGYHKRSDPATMYAKAQIDQFQKTGELGKLRYVRILMPAGDWVQNGFDGLITTDEQAPALVSEPPSDMDAETFRKYVEFVNYYIHQINLMRHLLGESYQVTYVDASGVMLAVRSQSGVSGVIEMSPYTTSLDWQESAFVAFEHGWVKLALPAPLVCNRAGKVDVFTDLDGRPNTYSPTLPATHSMRQQAENFLAAIRGDAQPMCTAQDALEDLKCARDYIRLLSEQR